MIFGEIWSKYRIHGKMNTLEEGNHTPKCDGTAAGILTKWELKEEKWEAGEHQVGEVGDEEGSWR